MRDLVEMLFVFLASYKQRLLRFVELFFPLREILGDKLNMALGDVDRVVCGVYRVLSRSKDLLFAQNARTKSVCSHIVGLKCRSLKM